MKKNVTTLTAVVILGIIIAIAVIIALFCNPVSYETSCWHTLFAILPSMSIFIIFLFYYSIIEVQETQYELIEMKETNRLTEIIFKDVSDEIKEASEIIPSFVSSICPLIGYRPEMKDKKGVKELTQIYVLSTKIFSSWQSVILGQEFVKVETASCMCLFLQRASSKKLYREWKKYKGGYNERTKRLGDLLFEYGLNMICKTPEEFELVSKEIFRDSRMKDIFDEENHFSRSGLGEM